MFGRLRAVAILVGALALIAILAPRMPLYYVRTADNVLIYLILAMTGERTLRMKPQNLLVGLPLARGEPAT